MPAVARQGDSTSGHGCFPPQTITSGCGTVMAEGKPLSCVGDDTTPHSCPKVPPHSAPISAGSGTVMAEGKPVARIGDAIGCGSTISSGAGTVFAN